MFNSYMPVQVFGGEEVLLHEAERLRRLGSRCLIVSGKNSAKASGALDDLLRVCKEQGIAWEAFDEIEPNPNVTSCFRAAARARMTAADFVVGVGGGSPLDACKVIALLARNDLDVGELYAQKWRNPALPVVCVGTTAGTGSEVTRVSVLTVDGRKRSITADALAPTLSFCDPRYTRTCGYATTMSCGLDALCHAVEGYFAARSTALTDSIAMQAVRCITTGLFEIAEKYPEGGENVPLSLRNDLYTGAILAGYVINDTGTCFPHAMGYILTEDFGIPHGYACAWFLADYLEQAMRCAPRKVQQLGIRLDKLSAFVKKQLPQEKIEMSREQIAVYAERFAGNKNFKNSPGSPSETFGQSILEKYFLGK